MRLSPRVLTGALLLLAPLPVVHADIVVGYFASPRSGRPLDYPGTLGYSVLLAELQNPANFGPGGTVTQAVSIASPTTTLTAAYLADKDVFFTSCFTTPLDVAESAALASWVLAGGTVITNGDSAGFEGAQSVLDALALGTVAVGNTCPNSPTGGTIHAMPNGASVGPFGDTTGGTFGTSSAWELSLGPAMVPVVECPAQAVMLAYLPPGAVGPGSGGVLVGGDPSAIDLFTNATSSYFNPNQIKVFLNVFAESASTLGTNYCLSTTKSTGAASTIHASGSPSIAANSLQLTADHLPSQPGIFIAGPTPAQIPFMNGFLCIDPVGLQRFNDTSAPAGGVITEAVDYATSAAGGLNVVAGASYHFQRWNRDPAAGGSAANFSDAVAIAMEP